MCEEVGVYVPKTHSSLFVPQISIVRIVDVGNLIVAKLSMYLLPNFL
jgi:hypothetical protein